MKVLVSKITGVFLISVPATTHIFIEHHNSLVISHNFIDKTVVLIILVFYVMINRQ